MTAATGTAENARSGRDFIDRSSHARPLAGADILLIGLERLAPPFIAGFEAEGLRTVAAENEEEALSLVQSHRPSVVLVGQEMEGDPLALLYDLNALRAEALILFLTPNSEAGPALEALAHGADDVIPPPHSVASVLLRARILRLRDERSNPAGANLGSNGRHRLVVDRFSRTLMDGEEPVTLTGREFELLDRLLDANGQVVRREQLLADIWGAEQDNEAVLDATVHRLRRKLENNPGQPAILTTVRGIGYRLAVKRIRVTGG